MTSESEAMMTRRQNNMANETEQAIRDYIKANHMSPTVRELGKILDLSPAPTAARLDELVKRGVITRTNRMARSIQLVERGKSLSEIKDDLLVKYFGAVRDELYDRQSDLSKYPQDWFDGAYAMLERIERDLT